MGLIEALKRDLNVTVVTTGIGIWQRETSSMDRGPGGRGLKVSHRAGSSSGDGKTDCIQHCEAPCYQRVALFQICGGMTMCGSAAYIPTELGSCSQSNFIVPISKVATRALREQKPIRPHQGSFYRGGESRRSSPRSAPADTLRIRVPGGGRSGGEFWCGSPVSRTLNT